MGKPAAKVKKPRSQDTATSILTLSISVEQESVNYSLLSTDPNVKIPESRFSTPITSFHQTFESSSDSIRVLLRRHDRSQLEFESKKISKIHPLVIEAFYRYSWPGNIRELENLIERAFILEKSDVLTPESFPGEIFECDSTPVTMAGAIDLSLPEARNLAIEAFERGYLKELLTRNKGKIQDSARAAGITTRQLHKLMTRYGIHKEYFK